MQEINPPISTQNKLRNKRNAFYYQVTKKLNHNNNSNKSA